MIAFEYKPQGNQRVEVKKFVVPGARYVSVTWVR